MDMALPDVSIVLVCWNTRDLLLACLASLAEAVGDLRADVWVVDNASGDGSVEALRSRFPHVHMIANARNIGFAAANNQAIMRSAGRYVLLLNSDTLPPPGSIARLVRFADDRPSAGIVGPLLLYPDRRVQHAGMFLAAMGQGRHAFRGRRKRQTGAARHFVQRQHRPLVQCLQDSEHGGCTASGGLHSRSIFLEQRDKTLRGLDGAGRRRFDAFEKEVKPRFPVAHRPYAIQ